MTFLPIDYEAPKPSGGGLYQMPKRRYNTQILRRSYHRVGMVGIHARHREAVRDVQFERLQDEHATQKAKHFWACAVWNYEANAVRYGR